MLDRKNDRLVYVNTDLHRSVFLQRDVKGGVTQTLRTFGAYCPDVNWSAGIYMERVRKVKVFTGNLHRCRRSMNIPSEDHINQRNTRT